MTTCKATLCIALALTMLLCGTTVPAQADFIYDLTVNTAGLSGTPGSVDIQFNPEGTTGGTGLLTATVQTMAGNDTTVGGFTTNPQFTPTPIGNVTGTGLPLTFTADNINGPASNDAVLNVTFGPTQLALSVNVSTGDNLSSASLYITVYDQNLNTLSSIPNSAQAVELDITGNPTGGPPTLLSQTGPGATAYVVPEPTFGVLLVQGLACVFVFGVVRRRKRLTVAA